MQVYNHDFTDPLLKRRNESYRFSCDIDCSVNGCAVQREEERGRLAEAMILREGSKYRRAWSYSLTFVAGFLLAEIIFR